MGLMDNSIMGHGKRLPVELQSLLYHLRTRDPMKWMPKRGEYKK